MRKLLRRVHRWVGLLAALWVLVLAGSGFLLQHSGAFGLDAVHTQQRWLLQHYGHGRDAQAFESAGHSLWRIDNQLIQSGEVLTELPVPISSAVHLRHGWVVADRAQIWWINAHGDIRQHMDALDGLPQPIESLGAHRGELLIIRNGQPHRMNPTAGFSAEPLLSVDAPTQVRPLTTEELENAFSLALGEQLSYEKLLFDLHAGLLVSPWLNDLTAAALFYLAISGVWMFAHPRRRRRD